MKNIEKANELFKQAWNEMHNLNFDKAIELLCEADHQGHDEALCYAGYCCQFKMNDIYGAIKFYKEAVSKKNGNACYLLSVCYRKGYGVEKNKEEADRLLQLSKEYDASLNNEGFNDYLSQAINQIG